MRDNGKNQAHSIIRIIITDIKQSWHNNNTRQALINPEIQIGLSLHCIGSKVPENEKFVILLSNSIFDRKKSGGYPLEFDNWNIISWN